MVKSPPPTKYAKLESDDQLSSGMKLITVLRVRSFKVFQSCVCVGKWGHRSLMCIRGDRG